MCAWKDFNTMLTEQGYELSTQTCINRQKVFCFITADSTVRQQQVKFLQSAVDKRVYFLALLSLHILEMPQTGVEDTLSHFALNLIYIHPMRQEPTQNFRIRSISGYRAMEELCGEPNFHRRHSASLHQLLHGFH